MYTTLAPLKCRVYTRLCAQATCRLKWDYGRSNCVHVLSTDTCAGDEIGWLFVNRVLSCGQTFSAFCDEMSQIYKCRNIDSRPFMSTPVFLRWWYSWASNQNIDFRKPCHICKHTPKRLACDGTRIGIMLKNVECPPINDISEANVSHPTHHRRNDRCFLSFNESCSAGDKSVIRECRDHLGYFSRKHDGKQSEEAASTATGYSS